MQAVVLAAGKGARLRPITNTTPKPLIDIHGKPLIEHVLDALPKDVDELFIVVNHLRDQIIERLGNTWNEIPIQYVIQEPLSGTAGALWLLRTHLKNRFLVVNSDDLYAKEDLEELTKHDRSILVFEGDKPLEASALEEHNMFAGLGPGTMAVCGAYVLGTELFEATPVEIQVSKYHEYGLPQTLATLIQKKPIILVKATKWQQVGTHEQLELAKRQ